MGEILSIEKREDRDTEFIREYVNNGGNATLAAKAVGVSVASASTVGHRLKMRLLPEVEVEAKEQLKGYVRRQGLWAQIALFDKRVFLAHGNH